MAPTCTTHANMYEEPRPPRRGSHRPTLVSCTPPRQNDWMNTRTGYGLASLPRYDVQAASIPVRERVEDDHPEQDESWTHGHLLPARRTNLQNTMSGRQRLINTERFTLSAACTDEAFYWFRSLAPSEPLPPFAARASTVGTNAPSSLELIRQFHDRRVPNRDALEQSILESYARSAPQSAACQSTQKRCMYPGCSKISVSRGLCRGHGGGRRCHVPGCTKSAQSRSNFCWAHGGGQRCDVDQCMRSRKSKHFCVSHMHLEPSHDGGSGSASPTNSTSMDHRTTACRAASGASGKKSNTSRATSPPVRALPSLGQALSSASRSAPKLPARSAKPFISV